MADYPNAGQASQYHKNFAPYVPNTKQFQPYVPPPLNVNTTSQSKFAEMKMEENKPKSYNYNPVSTPNSMSTINGFISPKA